jgi:hypothetical protein
VGVADRAYNLGQTHGCSIVISFLVLDELSLSSPKGSNLVSIEVIILAQDNCPH